MNNKKLTVTELGKMLREEFDRDGWGDVDPSYFDNPPKSGDGDMGGLYEVLERVAKRINQKFNPVKFTEENYK